MKHCERAPMNSLPITCMKNPCVPQQSCELPKVFKEENSNQGHAQQNPSPAQKCVSTPQQQLNQHRSQKTNRIMKIV